MDKFKAFYKENKKLMNIVGGLFIVMIIVITVTMFGSTSLYAAEKTYTYGEADKTYTVAATDAVPAKEAVYKEHKPVTVNVGDENANQEGAYGGDDIPVGEYQITNVDASDSTYCTLFKTPADDFEFVPTGSQVKKNQVINITENNKLVAYNCEGGMTVELTPTEEKELVSPATEAIPAKPEYDTIESVEYIEDEHVDYTCKQDGKVVECNQLKYADELKDEAKANSEDITESMGIYSHSGDVSDFEDDDTAVCQYNELNILCSDLKYEDDLLTDLHTPSDNLV